MFVYTYNYDSSYHPAMPLIEIKVGAANTSPTLQLQVQVDSGADCTILPLNYLKQIKARKFQRKWMRTVTGQRVQVDLYLVAIQIGDLPPVRVAVTGAPDLNEAIVGRDLLNQLVVKLDGPAMVVEVLVS